MRSALEQTIQAFGAREWHRISKEVLASKSSDPLLIPSLPEFRKRFQGEISKLRHSLPQWSIQSFAGFLCSLPVPHWDLEFRQRGAHHKSLFFHRPFVASGFIALRWWKCILEKALAQKEISSTEVKYLSRLLSFLNDFELGFSKGVYRKDLLIKFVLAIRKKKHLSKWVVDVSPQLLHWFSLQAGFSS